MFEFLTGWEFWVGGALFSALSMWPAWKLGFEAGRMDMLFRTEIMKDGEWVPAKSFDPKTRESPKGKTMLSNVWQLWIDKRG